MAPFLCLAILLAAPPALAQKAVMPDDSKYELRPRSDVSSYLVTVNDPRKFFRLAYYKAVPDDAKKLAADAELAARAYEYLRGGKITFKDDQKFTSMDFFMRSGNASLNPDLAQTSRLQSKIEGYFATGPVLQVDLIYEALVATDGNMTMAFASLGELFCGNRNRWIPLVADMENFSGKNYYRYSGAYVGLHGVATRTAGQAALYANISGNPLVFAGAEVYDSWKSFFTTGKLIGIDTLKTMGPDGNGNIVEKGGEFHKGFTAADDLREKF